MIEFLEHHSPKYPGRTSDNVIESDATLAFALSFDTSGEKLTKHYCQLYSKPYIPVDIAIIIDFDIDRIVRRLQKNNVSSLNIAGNSLYTLKKIMPKCTQAITDRVIYETMAKIISRYSCITQIRSGGQSGADEAGLKAALQLGIPAYCLCPKGWPYITVEGATVYNEFLFKERFNIVT